MEENESEVSQWRDYLREALKALPKKKKRMDQEEAYYEGRHPRVWMTKKMRKMFRNGMCEQMNDNLCWSAINAYRDRLRVEAFELSNVRSEAENTSVLSDLWDKTGMIYEQVDMIQDALVFDEAFLFSQRGSAALGIEDEVNVVDPRYVYWPTGTNPRDPRFVVLLVPDYDDNTWRAEIYVGEMLLKAVGPRFDSGTTPAFPDNHEAFNETEFGPHGFSRVPVDRISMRSRSYPLSMLRQLMPGQDRLNKLSANKMVAAEFGAFHQLAAITGQQVEDGALERRPDSVITLHPGFTGEGGTHPTQIVQIQATPLSNYDDSIMLEKKAFYTLANLPQHMLTGVSGSISGETIKADSGPFYTAIAAMQEAFGASLKNFAALWGYDEEPVWRDLDPDTDMDNITAVKMAVDSQIPVDLAVQKYGNWEPDELEQLADRKADDREISQLGQVAQAQALGALDEETARQTAARLTNRRRKNGGNDGDERGTAKS